MTNLVFTSGPNRDPSGIYNIAAIEGVAAANVLDTAGDVTSPLDGLGFQQHDWNFALASVGTNVVVALEARLSPTGAWVEVTVSSALTANGNYKISYNGLAVQTRLKLKSISTGTPTINTIAGASYNRLR